MRWKLSCVTVLSAAAVLAGLWILDPTPSGANGGGDEEEEHVHIPAPLDYADEHLPLSVWTDQTLIARGKEIYAVRCAVCHGETGDGHGPAAQGFAYKPPDLTDDDVVNEMRDNFWYWRISEGAVGYYKERGSVMPAWKGQLTREEIWALIAYQHTFSGHAGPHVPWEHPEMVVVGRDIYAMACASCHGVDGRGDGSVGPMLAPRRAPQPRDFTQNDFKLRSTPSGELPTTADLFRVVTEGIAGDGGPLTFGLRRHRLMPSFRHMPEEQRLEVLEYVKSLNPEFWARRGTAADYRPVERVAVPPAPRLTDEQILRGKQLYADAECLACHGAAGRGDGESAPTLRDNRDLPIRATDLTRPHRFKNGSRPQDVYRTLVTGLAGTPMPSYADALDPAQTWDLVYYVLSLSRDGRRIAERATPTRE